MIVSADTWETFFRELGTNTEANNHIEAFKQSTELKDPEAFDDYIINNLRKVEDSIIMAKSPSTRNMKLIHSIKDLGGTIFQETHKIVGIEGFDQVGTPVTFMMNSIANTISLDVPTDKQLMGIANAGMVQQTQATANNKFENANFVILPPFLSNPFIAMKTRDPAEMLATTISLIAEFDAAHPDLPNNKKARTQALYVAKFLWCAARDHLDPLYFTVDRDDTEIEAWNKKRHDNCILSSNPTEFKELRKELSAVKKRIDQLEESEEKQKERIDILERENHALKSQLNHTNGNKAVGSILKRKRTNKDQYHDEETESKSPSASTCNKKTKTKNNDDDDDETVVIPRYDNGDSFDSLSDDLLHKIVEFDGNCYNKFGSINKRCKNIYDVKEYKLKKKTCLYGYGTVDMMLEYYLQKRREGRLDDLKLLIAAAVIMYNRLDAIEWIIQLGDIELLKLVCSFAAEYGRINILSKVFCKLNLTMLDETLNDTDLCYGAAYYNQLETLKWLRKYGARWNADTFIAARDRGHDEIVQYLRAEGCPEQDEDTDESSVGSDVEDGDNQNNI